MEYKWSLFSHCEILNIVKDPSHNQSLLIIQLFLKHFTILPMFLNNEWVFLPVAFKSWID